MPEPIAPKTILGSYEPLLRLATGGMATVYVARQIGAAGFQRLVVIKRVHPHLLVNSSFYEMFREEARVSSLIHHPNVVPVINVVEWEGELLLVMEYVESSALSTLNKYARHHKKRIPVPVIVRIMADTLLGLQAAHEAVDMRGRRLDIVHRDVSPQNIIVALDGTSRLIDFGIAKARHSLTDTREGSLKGKFGYMSPEQTQGLPLDPRADVFSAGVVLHETLTGQPLFQCGNEFEAMRRINEDPVPDPSAVQPDLPSALDAVVHKALMRDREQRYQSASEFLEALENVISPAPAREVQAVVKAFCGERLARRRAALQSMLEGTLEPLRFTEVEDRLFTPSHASVRDAPTFREGPETHVSVVHDTGVTQHGPWRKRAIWIVGAASLLAGASAWALLSLGGPARRSTSSIGAAASRLAASWAPAVSGSAESAPGPADGGPDAAPSASRKTPVRTAPPRSELHGNPYGSQ